MPAGARGAWGIAALGGAVESLTVDGHAVTRARVIPSRAMSRGACIAVAPRSRSHAAPAHAYEFWLRAQTIGQAYQLRDYQLVGPDLFLGRRRVTQTLALRITDIGDLVARRAGVARLPERGLRISWQSYLRIDHDFGDYTSGQIRCAGPIRARRDRRRSPSSPSRSPALDLMYGYLQLDGLADDRLTRAARPRARRRRLGHDRRSTAATARYELPACRSRSTASAGLRVRASSPLGVSAYELDGTSGAGCQEYVEGPTPGTGSWQLIDRNRDDHEPRRSSSDYEYCPQRDVRQPTVGVTLATDAHAALRRRGRLSPHVVGHGRPDRRRSIA